MNELTKKEIRIELIDKDGNRNTYIQKDVRTKKIIEALELMDDFDSRKIKTNVEGARRKIELVASCFDDERVTPEAILEGLPIYDFEASVEGIIEILLGVDEEVKKGQAESPSLQEK